MSKFKVGDKVRANELSNRSYDFTTLKNHCEGIVTKIYNNTFDLKITKCDIETQIGSVYIVRDECFDLVEEPTIKSTNKEEEEGNKMNFITKIERYIINDKAVIIFWKDGNKTIAKVDENDKFDKQIGFTLAFHKYLNRSRSKTEMKKIYECISNDKLKDYLFIIFNRFTFENKIKAIKYLESLEVTK